MKNKRPIDKGGYRQVSLLDDVYSQFGYRSLPSCVDGLAQLHANGYSTDRSLVAFHSAWLATAYPDAFPVPQGQKIIFDDIEYTKHLAAQASAWCFKMSNILEKTVEITETFIEDVPTSHPLGTSMVQAQACEAVLWRAYDGLKSITLLQPEGLYANCTYELRASQEALLLFDYFALDEKNAVTFKVSSLYEDAIYIAKFIKFNKDKFHQEDPQLQGKFATVSEELSKFGLGIVLDDKNEVQISLGKKPPRNPNWHKLVDRSDLKEVYGTDQQNFYHDVFMNGNQSAHSLSAIWPGYCDLEENRLVTKGTTTGKPSPLSYIFGLTCMDMLYALEKARPNMEPTYGDWCKVAYFDFWHSSKNGN